MFGKRLCLAIFFIGTGMLANAQKIVYSEPDRDDSRPTEIIKLHTSPDFFYLFSGKINSIYEIEKVVDR